MYARKHIILCIGLLIHCIGISCISIAQKIQDIPLPVFIEPTVKVYVSPYGNDKANGSKDFPLQTFQAAFSQLQSITSGSLNRVPCAIMVLPGRYILSDIIEQNQARFSPDGSQNRLLDISIIGEGNPIIDGSAIKKSGGFGLIRLCGSHITVQGLIIKNSPSYGLVIGQSFARSTHVNIENISIDSTYDHGIMIGDINSNKKDTVHISHCRITETNRKNEFGLAKQWGSAIKLYGASTVLIDSCFLHRNWGEAICINSSSEIEIHNTTIFDNWGPAVYCDIARNVSIHSNLIVSTADSTIYSNGKRGMIGVLVSVEAWDPFQQELYTENIDIYSNVFMNCSGILDIWEGTLSFIQTATFRNIRLAFNSAFGLKTGANNQNASFISTVFSSPYPVNRMLQNILIYGNILSANPLEFPHTLWVRSSAEPLQYITFAQNRWNRIKPSIGNHDIDDTGILPDSIMIDNIIPEPDLMKRVQSLDGIITDYFGMKRGADSTLAGAFSSLHVSGIYQDHISKTRGTFGIFPHYRYIVDPKPGDRKFSIISIDGRTFYEKVNDMQTEILLPSIGPYFIIEHQ
jgi:hypothetical protein